ncbi:geranylgeranyl reductase family protein [Glycomyces buryatensis]|uniref:Geranylgeranyl reductase family protein n=1 Tax=Glycomyces buryatensis TaxID=2570927 RepID=A0A4S8Q9C0_9ACTN|nr:geranylgeranyl reductase family protein [Glycomyces buryatensis]THV40820.1 geranylgeranyl reductase family protein [Glycomyces buryatensis]
MTTHATPDADVIVVGAGPGGSAAAYHLAARGVDVLLLEKTHFPREKVCGDGLTPRSVAQLLKMGVDTSESAGWIHNKGLRVVADDAALEIDWPVLESFPSYGLARTRMDFDEILAARAVAAGASLQTGVRVVAPVFDLAGRVTGVSAEQGGETVVFKAPLVIAADGVSGRLALSLGIKRDEKRPMGVAVRQYYKSPLKHDDDYLESHLALRTAEAPDVLQPGYGWIFGLGDGRVNVGLGVLNSSTGYQKTNYRSLLRNWLENTPEEWGLVEESNADGPVRGAALPMGFNRVPHYSRGLMLVGDAGGMVNPFNGEGIAYAIESGEIAADIVAAALREPTVPRREAALRRYPERMDALLGSYYRMGGIFVDLIGRPQIMKLCTEHGLKHPALMRLVLKLLANLTDRPGRDTADRIVNGMRVVTPRLGRANTRLGSSATRGKPRSASFATRANVRLASVAEERS